MVSEEFRTGLYITMPVYFLVLAGAAYWAHVRMGNMETDGTSDKMTNHYLGGRQFGPLLMMGTLFASLFSGYTVIGVPNDAYNAGFYALRWFPNTYGVVFGFFTTGVRLRKAGVVRNHSTPNDFITDRYQSNMLRYTIFALQIAPTLFYLSAQVVSIKETFNSIFEINEDSNLAVIVIFAMILIFEWVGGLNSVALTDSIQGIVMVTSWVILPLVIVKNYGGWSTFDPETFPKPEFYQTLTKKQNWGIAQFGVVNFSFFTLPHLMQRTYAAKDLTSLKAGYSVMLLGPWIANMVGTYFGVNGVQILSDQEGTTEAVVPDSPFASVLETIMGLGGFAQVTGIIAFTASIAAIMSTADSLIIAISQLITVELIQPFRPDAGPIELAMYGKASSLAAVVVAVMWGIFWDDGIAEVTSIQFALSGQCVPSFAFGLFASNKRTDVHPWILSFSAIVSAVFVSFFYFGYQKVTPDAPGYNTGVTGVILNFFLCFILSAIQKSVGGAASFEETPQAVMKGENEVLVYYSGRPEWDVPELLKYGDDCLTPDSLWKHMAGVVEPITHPSWVCFMMLAFFLITPWTAAGEPPFDPTGENVFMYPPRTYRGMPWWYAKGLVICFATGWFLFASVWISVPSDYPENEHTNAMLAAQSGKAVKELVNEKTVDDVREVEGDASVDAEIVVDNDESGEMQA